MLTRIMGAAAIAAAAATVPVVAYRPPIDSPVVDPFRPPASTWGPGNRGIDYDVEPGSVVRAPADGVVRFAGQVGGQLFVVLGHADGLRTTVGFLTSILVHPGEHVRQGQALGTAAGDLHFGARRGDTYLDPAGLLGGRRSRVHLVPLTPKPAGEGSPHY